MSSLAAIRNAIINLTEQDELTASFFAQSPSPEDVIDIAAARLDELTVLGTTDLTAFSIQTATRNAADSVILAQPLLASSRALSSETEGDPLKLAAALQATSKDWRERLRAHLASGRITPMAQRILLARQQ